MSIDVQQDSLDLGCRVRRIHLIGHASSSTPSDFLPIHSDGTQPGGGVEFKWCGEVGAACRYAGIFTKQRLQYNFKMRLICIITVSIIRCMTTSGTLE